MSGAAPAANLGANPARIVVMGESTGGGHAVLPIAAGGPSELVAPPGAFHGFDAVAPETGLAKRFTAAKIAALRRAFRGRWRTDMILRQDIAHGRSFPAPPRHLAAVARADTGCAFRAGTRRHG